MLKRLCFLSLHLPFPCCEHQRNPLFYHKWQDSQESHLPATCGRAEWSHQAQSLHGRGIRPTGSQICVCPEAFQVSVSLLWFLFWYPMGLPWQMSTTHITFSHPSFFPSPWKLNPALMRPMQRLLLCRFEQLMAVATVASFSGSSETRSDLLCLPPQSTRRTQPNSPKQCWW